MPETNLNVCIVKAESDDLNQKFDDSLHQVFHDRVHKDAGVGRPAYTLRSILLKRDRDGNRTKSD